MRTTPKFSGSSRTAAVSAALVCVAAAPAASPAPVSAAPVGSAGPATFRVAPCPVPQSELSQSVPSPPSIPATVAIPPAIAVPAGSSMYGTAFPGEPEPFVFVLAPEGFSCSASPGVDSAQDLNVLGPHNHDGVRAIVIPGGVGLLDDLACEYFPAARSVVSSGEPCTAAAPQDAVSQLPTGSTGVLAAAVRVPPKGSFPTFEPTGSTDPTLAVVSVGLGAHEVQWAQAISCTLPVAQQAVCEADLALFLTHTRLGEALSQSQLGATLGALAAALKAAVAFQPAEPCDVERLGLKLSGQADAGIFQVGVEDALDWGRRSDAKWDIDADGKFKVGLGGVFGDSVSTSVGGGGGAGASGSIAAGLELGVGFGFDTTTAQDGRTLVDALTGNAMAPQGGVQLTSTTLNVGAWLSGDIGVSSGEGHLDGEAVLGVKTDLEDGREVDSEYYLEANLAVDLLGSAPAGSIAQPLSGAGGGFAEGSLLVGEVIDAEGEPSSGEIELDFAGGASGAAKGPVAHVLHGALNAAAGQAADVKLSLPLSSARAQSMWSGLISGQNGESLGGLFGEANASSADQALAREMAMTAVLYQEERGSGSIAARFGDGLGAGLQLEGEGIYQKAVAAEAKAPGALQAAPWTACVGSGGKTQ